MTNVIQFPTVKTTDELNNLLAEATYIAKQMQEMKIDASKPIKIVKRTLNDVSPAEWDAVARSIMDRQAIHTK